MKLRDLDRDDSQSPTKIETRMILKPKNLLKLPLCDSSQKQGNIPKDLKFSTLHNVLSSRELVRYLKVGRANI